MRTTITIDDDLLRKAVELNGIEDRRTLINEALKAIIAREAQRRLALLGGSDPKATYIRRR